MAGKARTLKSDKFTRKKVVNDAYTQPPTTDDAYNQPAVGSDGYIDWTPNARQEHPRKEGDKQENVKTYHA
jgi:hypothetical protein